jgi:plasmid stability protein
MASITIRDLPDSAKDLLRVQAAKAGVSLEAYARELLHAAARNPASHSASDLLGLSRALFGGGKGVDLELPSRRSSRPEVGFDP